MLFIPESVSSTQTTVPCMELCALLLSKLVRQFKILVSSNPFL